MRFFRVLRPPGDSAGKIPAVRFPPQTGPPRKAAPAGAMIDPCQLLL